MRRKLPFVLAASALLLGIVAAPAALAQAKPLQVQESNVAGINAELVQATVSDGVLTVKVRYRNTGPKGQYIELVGEGSDIDKYYVVAGKTKLLPLRDSEKVPLMSALRSDGHLYPEIAPGGSFLMWIKFPAPPAGTKKVGIYSRQAPPFDDVPITEAQ